MRPFAARARGRSDHSRLALAAFVILGGVGCGSAGTVPRPRFAPVSAEDYVAVPNPPRVPQVEILPAQPDPRAVWVDGSWRLDGERYRWQAGAWVIAPPGARLSAWAIVRRREDGQLFFAPSVWRDEAGRPIDAPEALARSRSRARPDEGE